MTSFTRMLLATMLTLAVVATPGRGGEAEKANLDILRESIRANRKAMVAANLTLTDEEAKNFWPIYDRYAVELKAVNDRSVQVITDYIQSFKDVSDEKALKLADDYIAAESDRVNVRRSYLQQFSKVMPGRKVARFYQIEYKMDAVLRYELAETVPVVEEKAAK